MIKNYTDFLIEDYTNNINVSGLPDEIKKLINGSDHVFIGDGTDMPDFLKKEDALAESDRWSSIPSLDSHFADHIGKEGDDINDNIKNCLFPHVWCPTREKYQERALEFINDTFKQYLQDEFVFICQDTKKGYNWTRGDTTKKSVSGNTLSERNSEWRICRARPYKPNIKGIKNDNNDIYEVVYYTVEYPRARNNFNLPIKDNDKSDYIAKPDHIVKSYMLKNLIQYLRISIV